MATLSLRDLPELPANSAIQVEETFAGVGLQWRSPSGGRFARYGVALFLLFWLGGWGLGVVSVLEELLEEARSGEGLSWFLVFWLGGWLVGGGFAIFFLTRLITPGKPELLILGDREFRHRTGTPPLILFTRRYSDWPRFWGQFRKLTSTAADKDVLGNLRLERVGERQRLTVDLGADRVEIGEYLREPDREWLADVLQLWLAQG